MRLRRGGRHEEGVSNVLGAILMFGLLVLTLTVIQVRYVPVWAEDREARHMADLQDQLAQLKADLDRMAGNDTASGLSDPLTLKRGGGFTFFSSPTLGGQATFVPAAAGTGVSVASTHEVNVVRRDGQDLYSLDDDNWQPDFVDGTIEQVSVVNHLRARVDVLHDASGDSYLDPDMPAEYTDGDSVTLEIFEATDDVDPVATVVISFHAPGSGGSEVWFLIEVFDKSGARISSDVEASFQALNVEYMFFDLFDGALFLQPLLAAAQQPLTLELTESGLVADYQVAYTDAASGSIAGGAGLREPSFSEATSSSRLQVVLDNQRFVDQTYTLEHGAVVLAQGSDAILLVPPALTVQSSGSVASLTFTLPALSGDAVTRSGGRGINAVALPLGDVSEVWLSAYELTLNIPTAYGAAWCAYLDGVLADAGLSDTGAFPNYVLTSSTVGCELDLYGPTGNPADTTQSDVFLRYRSSAIDLDLVPG